MEAPTAINNYFVKIADKILKIYKSDFSNQDQKKSCIKISGFPLEDLIVLQQKIALISYQCFILEAKSSDPDTRINIAQLNTLVEHPNEVLFLLVPDNKNIDFTLFSKHSSTPELSRAFIEGALVKELIDEIPEEFRLSINNDIIGCIEYVKEKKLPPHLIINYLLSLNKVGYTIENIGNYIYELELIPDSYLLTEDSVATRNRLNSNLDSISSLVIEGKPLYDRISQLPIVANTIQRFLVDLFRNEKNINTESALCQTIYKKYPQLNFANWEINDDKPLQIALPDEHIVPKFDIMVGSNSKTIQYGIVGESITGRKIAIDLSGTNTISLFGVQGGGKSYTIGTISEMVLKQFSGISELPSPLAGVIFHYSESMDYEPEFTSMIYPNSKKNEILKLKKRYGADPDSLDDVIIICPKDKVEEKRLEYPSVQIEPIAFSPNELNVQDWMFMLGALGSEANYVKQLKSIAKKYRKGISIDAIEEDVKKSILFTEFEKGLALQKLDFAREYVDDSYNLSKLLMPGRLIIVDLRDEFIDKDEALGLFVIILNIFSAVKEYKGDRFNKFIVFDEAHKYMDNVKLTSTIVTAIREMRHKGVNIMIASQDPPSLPKEIIELSSVVLLHKFNSPQWLDHIKNALTQLEILSPQDMSMLSPGEGYLWATKATEKGITYKPLKISARPRVTQHGGGTLQAGGKK